MRMRGSSWRWSPKTTSFDVSIVKWSHRGPDRPVRDSGFHEIMFSVSASSMARPARSVARFDLPCRPVDLVVCLHEAGDQLLPARFCDL
jgi:hypothetical protein